MNGIVGRQISKLGGDNSFHIPGNSTMSQNGPFKLAEAGKRTPTPRISTKRKARPGNRNSKKPQSQGDNNSRPKSTYIPDVIEKIVESVMTTCLQDIEYETETCIRLSQSLAGTVMEKIKPFSDGHYKLVVVVSIGNSCDKSGLQFGSRCLWNKDSDSFLSVKYSNDSLFAVAMVYCLLFE